jgi:hypothetical protein
MSKYRPFTIREAERLVGLRVCDKHDTGAELIVGVQEVDYDIVEFILGISGNVRATALLENYEFVLTPPWTPRYRHDAKERHPDLCICGVAEVGDDE